MTQAEIDGLMKANPVCADCGTVAPEWVSINLGIMLCISSFIRCYWSLSPPPIWSDEPLWIQGIAVGDMVGSVFTWSLVVIFSTKTMWALITGEQTKPDIVMTHR